MTPDCENVLGRRDVVTHWKIELPQDRNVIAKAKPAVVEIFTRDATGTPKALGEHPPDRHAHLPGIEWPILRGHPIPEALRPALFLLSAR
jgi:hypothetical protein